jgi:hypothetical protein
VTLDKFERKIDQAFSKRIRLVAENSHAQFSSAGCSGATTVTFTSAPKAFSVLSRLQVVDVGGVRWKNVRAKAVPSTG